MEANAETKRRKMTGVVVNDKMDKTGVMHKDLGLGLTLFNPEEQWYRHTLIQHAIIAKKRKEELDEAVRVLYVAFTRSMDKLVLLGSVSDWDKDEIKFESGAKIESNYLGMVYPYAEQAGISVKIMNRDQLQQTTKKQMERLFSIENLIDKALEVDPVEEHQTTFINTIEHRLSYVYPNDDAKNKKSKYNHGSVYTNLEQLSQ